MKTRIQSLLIGAAFCIVLASVTQTVAQQNDVITVEPATKQPLPASSSATSTVVSDRVPLKLCDCQPATGDPGSLSCDKEGFFISSFERQGQWVTGGGSVPLSRAICCRPCLPEDLPSIMWQDNRALENSRRHATQKGITADSDANNLNTKNNDSLISTQQHEAAAQRAALLLALQRNALSRSSSNKPTTTTTTNEDDPSSPKALAVVSFGCHASTSDVPGRCEPDTDGFVTGFTDALRIFTRVDTYYPVNQAQCCTPALLMDNGDAWELERCECQDSTDSEYPVNCNAADNDELLIGYDSYRTSPMGQVVPIGPARCCRVCLSGSYHPASDCAALHHCNGNGVCALGRCECLSGWGGADCSLPIGGSHIWHGPVPPWAVILIVVSSCLLASVLLLAGFNTLAWIQDQDGSDDDDDGDGTGEPLLLRIDADDTGSVGSQDTEYGDEDLEEVEQRIEGVIQEIEEARAADNDDGGDGGGEGSNNNDEGEGTVLNIEVEEGGEEARDGAPQAGEAALVVVDDEEEHQHSSSDDDDDDDISEQHEDEDEEEPAAVPTSSPPPATPQSSTAEQPDTTTITSPQAEAEAGEPTEKDAAAALRLGAFDGVGPLSSVDCSVCMIRPVQTVLVPCGHICMCRRCSRRLQKCPICRKDVARRQRLFV